jgi:hypothetical protein
MNEQTVDAGQAFGLMYALFQAMPWLVETGRPLRMVEQAEPEAIAFLLALADQQVSDWGGLSPEAQDTASALLVDFLGKLRQPGSPVLSATWTVPADAPAAVQALAIVAHEIRRAHPRQTTPH